MGFPGSSAGKIKSNAPALLFWIESTCNAGDSSSIPRSGRSAGEGIGYRLQYSWASPVAQMVKNLPTLRETWVWSLGWKDPLEKGKATHSSILAQRIPWTILFGSQTVGHDWATFTFHGDSLKKIGIKLQYDLAMPLLGIYPEKTTFQDTCTQCPLQHYLQ